MTENFNTEKWLEDIQDFLQLLSSSYGPFGRLKVFQAHSGGFSTVSSTAWKIVSLHPISNPLISIIASAIKCQLANFKDGGLFVGILASSLVLKGRATSVNHVIFERIINALFVACQSEAHRVFQSNAVIQVDISSLESVRAFCVNILCTKTAISLTKQALDHVSFLLVKGCSKCLPLPPDETQPPTQPLIYQHGVRTMESCNVDGILLESFGSSNVFLSWQTETSPPYKAVVIATSLAGDLLGSSNSSMSVADESVVFHASQQRLEKFVQRLVNLHIKILFCQKVVHPTFISNLEQKGIFVFSRLGLSLATSLAYLCKVPLAQHLEIDTRFVGSVGSISSFAFHNERYLSVQSADERRRMSTSIICAPNECALDELKIVCGSVTWSLCHLFNDPRTVPGGGCFETVMAAMLRRMKRPLDVQCTDADFRAVALAAAKSFEVVSMAIGGTDFDHYVDEINSHHWLQPLGFNPTARDVLPSQSCCCGMIRRTSNMKLHSLLELRHSSSVDLSSFSLSATDNQVPMVQDLLSARMEGISAAFEAASSVMRACNPHRWDDGDKHLIYEAIDVL